MKLTTSSLVLAIGAALALPTMAADIEIYGKANLTLQSNDLGEGSFTELSSNASRLGFKGTHNLENGLQVIYQAEFEVDLDGDSPKGDSITDRNQFIGLKGNFGTVLLGKNDTMLKQSQGNVDLFNDLSGDIKHLFKGENRMADTITYKSPSFNGIHFGVTYIAEDSVDGTNGYSVAAMYGDKKLKKSDIYASIAMDNDVNGYDVTRATVSGKISGITLGAMYQNQEKASGEKMDGYLVSAKYSIDNVTLKGQYIVADHDGGDNNTGASVGADYKLDNSTKLFAFYTNLDMDSNSDEDYLGVGIEYKF